MNLDKLLLRIFVFLFLFGGIWVSSGLGSDLDTVRIKRDITYAPSGDPAHRLDLHFPGADKSIKPTIIVWVHGGAWRSGSKASMPLKALVEQGYPVASVEYRLSTQARFPAQIHDIKAAIRFLRARGKELGMSVGKIVMAGDSAGAHLATLVGVSHGLKELEGSVGLHLAESTQIHGIISFYGASNLRSILKQSTPFGLNVRVSALDLLLGGQPDQFPELASLASPVDHVSSDDPPAILFHGDQDPQMPVNQTLELAGKYRKSGLDVELDIVHGGAHGGAEFYREEQIEKVIRFVEKLERGSQHK